MVAVLSVIRGPEFLISNRCLKKKKAQKHERFLGTQTYDNACALWSDN